MSKEKTCLVTGASSGIGRAICCEMVGKGWKVFALARRRDKLEELAGSLKQGTIIPLVCDVSDPLQVESVSEQILKMGISPELFFLNAGDGDEEIPGALDLDFHRRIFEVNYFGVMNWVSFWLPRVREKKAVFVATSSLQALRGMPGSAAYGASKAALTHAFQSLHALHHKEGLRFSIISPGPVDTSMLKTEDPLPVTWSPKKAAKYIVGKVEKGALDIRFPFFWSLVLGFLRVLPTRLYLKIVG